MFKVHEDTSRTPECLFKSLVIDYVDIIKLVHGKRYALVDIGSAEEL